jgi:hypothetical protein
MVVGFTATGIAAWIFDWLDQEALRMNFGKFNLALLIGHFIRVVTIVIVDGEIVAWANI